MSRFRAMRRPTPVYVQDWTGEDRHRSPVILPEHDYRPVAALLCFVAAVAVGAWVVLTAVMP